MNNEVSTAGSFNDVPHQGTLTMDDVAFL